MTMSMTDHTLATGQFGLLRAAEAVTNWRALAMCALSVVATMLIGMLTMQMLRHSIMLGLPFILATIAAMIVGYSAVGIILMRGAQGERVGFIDALRQAALTAHRFVGVGALLGTGWLALLLALLFVFFVCKIPGVGPLLYAIAYPIAAIVAGAAFAGMWYVGYPLAAPAIWQGNSTLQTTARLLHIGRHQLLGMIIQMFMLLLLVGVLSIIVFGILGTGMVIASSASMGVGIRPLSGLFDLLSGLGRVDGFGGLSTFDGQYGGYGMNGNAMGSASGNGLDRHSIAYLGSFGFGNGLLIAISLVIPFLTFVNGTCLIYLQTASGIDVSVTERKLRQRVADARRRARQARAAYASGAMTNPSTAPHGASPHAPTPTSRDTAAHPTPSDNNGATTCTQCHKPMGEGDLFCGECGTRRQA
ncbi:zinc ribbon domain-containing protein (plasmid) [Mycetohabitans rhizoxinica]